MPDPSYHIAPVRWHAEKYPPLWRCIYCGETDRAKLTDEHIIPFALLPKGGDWFLPKSSCYACADITKKFETQVLYGMFGPLRQQLGLKVRNRGAKAKKTGRMPLRRNSRDGKIWDEEIEVTSFPTLCIGFKWPVPAIIFDEVPTNEYKGELFVRCRHDDVTRYASDVAAFRIGTIGPLNFAKMLAKIAHSYAIAKYGQEAFKPLLTPLILGRIDFGQYFVGGDASETLPDQLTILHDVFRMDCRRDNGPDYLGVAVRLFAMMGMPRYHVIVGRCLKAGPMSEKRGDTIAVEFPFPRR
jgi:hypothetical protein